MLERGEEKGEEGVVWGGSISVTRPRLPQSPESPLALEKFKLH